MKISVVKWMFSKFCAVNCRKCTKKHKKVKGLGFDGI